MRTFVLCADDFAITESVSSGILDLIDCGSLSATSCLVTSKYWLQGAVQLRSRENRVDVGLHLNLVADDLLKHDPDYTPALQPYPRHSHLILSSLLGRLDKGQIIIEIERQLDRFVEGWGSLPDFVDGHLHVHQLPVVQDALTHVYKRRLAGKNRYVRNVADIIPTKGGWFKPAIIRALGGRRLREQLEEVGIPHNEVFGGIYEFNQNANYREMMRAWLRGVGQSGMLMCHPGLAEQTRSDPIGVCRAKEYEYLRSEAFTRDCEEAGVIPGRFRKTITAGTVSVHG